MRDKAARLAEFEKEAELSRLRDLLVDSRMAADRRLPARRPVKSLVEVSEAVTDASPALRKALSLNAARHSVVKHFDFCAADVLHYMLGRREALFAKLRVVDPERFAAAQARSDLGEFTHQDAHRLEPAEPWGGAEPQNQVVYKDRRRGLEVSMHTRIGKSEHAQLYLTDGHSSLQARYDFAEDLAQGGLPFDDPRFQRLQYVLYNGVNRRELEFRQVFLNHLLEDFEREHGALTWAQRTNVVAQFEEELFADPAQLHTLEDVLDGLEQAHGLFQKHRKAFSLDWVDAEVRRARQMLAQVSPAELRRQREFVESRAHEHRRFLHVGEPEARPEFEAPRTDEHELRLGMELLSQLDAGKARFWAVLKGFAVEADTDADTFRGGLTRLDAFPGAVRQNAGALLAEKSRAGGREPRRAGRPVCQRLGPLRRAERLRGAQRLHGGVPVFRAARVF